MFVQVKLNINQMKSLLSIICFCLSFITLFAQEAINVEVTTTDDKLIVTYDLEGEESTVYDVQLSFMQEDSSIVTPETLLGDYGDVLPGTGKAIIWKIYEDLDGLSGSIDPIITVRDRAAEKAKSSDDDKDVADTPTPPAPKILDMITKNTFKSKEKKVFVAGYVLATGNTSVLANRNLNFYNKKRSWEVGPYFRFNFNKSFHVQPEIIYHRQSYRRIINGDESSTNNHHYLRGQVILGVGSGLGMFLNGGVYYGYLLGGNERYISQNEDTKLSFNNFDEMNGESLPYLKEDIGYILGASLNFGQGSYVMGVRYMSSFESFINSAYYAGSENEGLELLNRGWMFFIQSSF